MSVQVQGDSQEAVAFGLMQCVLLASGRGNHDHPFPAGSTLLRGQQACNEHEILSLFSRCLRVVQGEEHVLPANVALASPRDALAMHS